MLAIYARMIGLRKTDPVLSVPSRENLSCEARGALLIARRWQGPEERWLVFNTGELPAPFDYASSEVVLSSAGTADGHTVPPLAAMVIARRA